MSRRSTRSRKPAKEKKADETVVDDIRAIIETYESVQDGIQAALQDYPRSQYELEWKIIDVEYETMSEESEEQEEDDGSDSDYDDEEQREYEEYDSDEEEELEYDTDEEDDNEALEKDPLVVELIRVNGNRDLLNKFQGEIRIAQKNLYDMAPNEEAKRWMAKLISSGITTKNLKKYAAWGVVGNKLAATLFGDKVGKVEVGRAKQMEGGSDINIGRYSYRTFNTANTRIHRVHTQRGSKWAHIMCAFQKNDGKWLLFDSNGDYTAFREEIQKFYEDKGGITVADFRPHRTEGDSTLKDNIFLYYNGRCASWTLWTCMMLTTLESGDVEKEKAMITYIEKIGSYGYGMTEIVRELRKNQARTLSTLIMCFWLRFQNIKDQLKLTPMQRQLMPVIKDTDGEEIDTKACREEMLELKKVFNEKVKELHGLESPGYTIDTSEKVTEEYEKTRRAFKTQFEWQVYFGLRKLKTSESKMQSIKDFKESTRKRLNNMERIFITKEVQDKRWGGTKEQKYEVRNRVTNIKLQRQKHTQVNIRMGRYSKMYPFVHESKNVKYIFRVNVVHALLPENPTWAHAFKFIRDTIEKDWNNKWIHVQDQVDLKAMFKKQNLAYMGNMFVWNESSLGAAKPSYTDDKGDTLDYDDYAESADEDFPLFMERHDLSSYPIFLDEPFPLDWNSYPPKAVKGKFPTNKKLYLHFDRLKYTTTNNDGEMEADVYGNDQWYFQEKNMRYNFRLHSVNRSTTYMIPGVTLKFNGAEIATVGDWKDLSMRLKDAEFGYFLNKIQRIRWGEKKLTKEVFNSDNVFKRVMVLRQAPYQKYTNVEENKGMPVLYKFTLKLIFNPRWNDRPNKNDFSDYVGVKAEVENVTSSIPDSFRWKSGSPGIVTAVQQLEDKLQIEDRTGSYRVRVDRIAQRAGNYNREEIYGEKQKAILPLLKKFQERFRIPYPKLDTIYLYGEIRELQQWDSVWKKVGGTFNGNYYVFDDKFKEWNKGFGIPEEDRSSSSSRKRKEPPLFKLFTKLKF